MKKNRYLSIFLTSIVLLTVCRTASGQHKSEIPVLAGERWWGAYTALGAAMPFEAADRSYRLGADNLQNQSAPFLVSSLGRYIWSDAPFTFRFDGRKFLIDSPVGDVRAVKAGKTLREAVILGKNARFRSNGQTPPERFFSRPQYNTWIELQYDQSQKNFRKLSFE